MDWDVGLVDLLHEYCKHEKIQSENTAFTTAQKGIDVGSRI
jgi:hypothetical protein